jgi:glycosyltransferase involved in cell wall biosynthesis
LSVERTAGAERLIVDLSTLARWSGPPTGMIRVESELARAAQESGDESLRMAFYDPRDHAFHAFASRWEQVLLSPYGALDTWGVDYRIERRGWRRLVPSRYPLVRALERQRLTAPSALLAGAADRLQAALLGVRDHRYPFRAPDGARIALVPADLGIGAPIPLGPGDAVFVAAYDWLQKRPAELAERKRRAGFRLSVLCHDILPMTHPQFFPPEDAAAFAAYWRAMLRSVDKVITTSEANREAIAGICGAEGIAPPQVAVVPLGTIPPRRTEASAPLRPGLERERFGLFVSTVEPRKNHRLLIEVWRRLVARGVPDRHRFKLVFVGRPGWMVEEVLADLASGEGLGGSLLHLTDVGDAELEQLYGSCAFCLYPSLFEGFGLPVVEAFARGKAVIASTGGALKEVVGDLGPSLDPSDAGLWERAIEAWITDPGARRQAEARVQAGYVERTWDTVAALMFAEARSA